MKLFFYKDTYFRNTFKNFQLIFVVLNHQSTKACLNCISSYNNFFNTVKPRY